MEVYVHSAGALDEQFKPVRGLRFGYVDVNIFHKLGILLLQTVHRLSVPCRQSHAHSARGQCLRHGISDARRGAHDDNSFHNCAFKIVTPCPTISLRRVHKYKTSRGEALPEVYIVFGKLVFLSATADGYGYAYVKRVESFAYNVGRSIYAQVMPQFHTYFRSEEDACSGDIIQTVADCII